MDESAGVPVLITGATDDQVAAVDRALRDAGYATHCNAVQTPGDFETAAVRTQPELILVFGAPDAAELQHAGEIRNKQNTNIPILLVTAEVDEALIAAAMDQGANDAVSLDNIARLQAVAGRELRSCRIGNALENVMGSAQQYKNELNSLKQVTTEAIADIQEGIIVNANPAWLELFGLDADTELTGEPIMDYCAEQDRPALKGALVACQRGKWKDSTLDINAAAGEGDSFPLSISLENIEHDDEPAVRMIISPEQTEEEAPERVIEQAVCLDPATSFYNQTHFVQSLSERLAKPPAGGVRAIAYIRPDRFAKVRDEVGLLGTETVITQFAQLLREYIQPNDIYGRFGGTMFTILLERGTMADVEAWAEQLVNAVTDTVFDHEESSAAVTCTIGMCEVDSANSTAAELLNDAEKACKSGRLAGGNRIELSEASGAAKKVRQDDTIWVPRIRGALMENRLRLEHQPVGSLNKDIDGAFDTLVRMLDEEGETILPSEFMPVAERTGLSKNIDRWVIGASLSFCAADNAQLVFVRLSRDSLKDDSLAPWLIEQAKQAGVEPAKLCFEISEELVSKHLRKAQKLAETLVEAGFKFAIEHFGTGGDCARLIKLIPMQYVKIDGSLMQGLHKNTDVQTTVKELARQATENNIVTIAERVQDANTMAVLWQLGIAHIQGNYVQTQEIVIEDDSQSTMTTQALSLDPEAEAPV